MLESKLSVISSYKDTNPMERGPMLMTCCNPDHLPKSSIFKYQRTGELQLSPMHLGRVQFSPWQSLCLSVSQTVKNMPVVQETQVRLLGREDLLEKGLATHSSLLA